MARVLVADDEVELAATLVDVLERAGHEARIAADASAALALAREFAPDLVISDWALATPPDGIALIEALRAQLPAARAILMSGYPSARLGAWARSAPGVGLLEKPFSLADFRAEVERVLAFKGPA